MKKCVANADIKSVSATKISVSAELGLETYQVQLVWFKKMKSESRYFCACESCQLAFGNFQNWVQHIYSMAHEVS